jgi:hypothetical protein
MFVDDMESENSTLKDRIRELEISLMALPIFASPIATIQPWKTLDRTPNFSSKLRGTSILLDVVKRYVGKNIEKKMSLILETWELVNSFISLALKMMNLKQFLQLDLENDEEFYKGEITTFFFINVSNMSELKRK